MLSVNYISNFLSPKQRRISNIYYNKINDFELNKDCIINDTNKLDKYCYNLPESFEILFNKSIKDFYYDSKIYKNKSLIFTFLNSLFSVGNELFNLNNEMERENIIKEFIKMIDNDLFHKDLYTKYEYNKDRCFNKALLQEVIKNAFKFNCDENFNLLKRYISDYLGINIYILHFENNILDISKSEYYLTKYYNNITKYVPNFIFIIENKIYKPVLLFNKENSIISYSSNEELIDNIWKYFNIQIIDAVEMNEMIEVNEMNQINKNVNNSANINHTSVNTNVNTIVNTSVNNSNKFTINDLKNLKIDDLRVLCDENNIPLQKKSDKTLKMINKLKIELITELLKI